MTWCRYGVSYYFVLQSEKRESTSGEFTLDIYVKEKNDDACRLKVITHSSLSIIVDEIFKTVSNKVIYGSSRFNVSTLQRSPVI